MLQLTIFAAILRMLMLIRKLLVLFLVLFIACKKENKNYNSRFTLVNAVPDSKAFRFSFANIVVDSVLVYGKTVYEKTVPASTSVMEWAHTASPAFDTSFITDIPNASDYTVLFYDSLAKRKAFIVKDIWKKNSDNKGFIRFFPMVIGGQQLNIRNDTNKIIINTKSFGSFAPSGSDFTEVDTFTTKLRLYEGAILLDSLPGTTIAAGKSYSIYAIGVLNEAGDKRPRMIIHQHE